MDIIQRWEKLKESNDSYDQLMTEIVSICRVQEQKYYELHDKLQKALAELQDVKEARQNLQTVLDNEALRHTQVERERDEALYNLSELTAATNYIHSEPESPISGTSSQLTPFPPSATTSSQSSKTPKPAVSTWAKLVSSTPPPSSPQPTIFPFPSAAALPIRTTPTKTTEDLWKPKPRGLDVPIIVDPAVMEKTKRRTKKLCNNHYVRGSCAKRYDGCDFVHDEKISSAEKQAVALVARLNPCTHLQDCENEYCIYGHHCPTTKKGVCAQFMCRYSQDSHAPGTIIKHPRPPGGYD